MIPYDRFRLLFLPLVAFGALIAGGCATPYQRTGIVAGGFRDMQLAPDVFRVSFLGNALSSPERVRDFAILRASEVTLKHGYRYFGIMRSTEGVDIHSYSTPGTITTTGTFSAGNYYATSTYIPGGGGAFAWPRTGLVIRCFREKPEDIPVLDAANVGSAIRRAYNIRSH